MPRPIDQEVVALAWGLRRNMVFTMREIAEQLGVDRTRLIEAMEREAERGQHDRGS